MKKLKKTFIIGLAAVALMATNAQASFVPIGEPEEVGSWLQNWNLSDGGFTHIDAVIRSGAGVTFESVAPWYGASSGWTTAYLSPTLAILTGSMKTSLDFAVTFTSDKATPLVADFYAWNGNTLKAAERGIWSGTQWTYGTPETMAGPAVPEPTTMVAGALLLLPFGVSTLRKLRENRVA